MSGRHRGIMVMSILAMGLGFAIVACSDGHGRCGGRHGRGDGDGKAGSAGVDEATPDFDATAGADVSRVPADPQVGPPDASDPDADPDAEADASAN